MQRFLDNNGEETTTISEERSYSSDEETTIEEDSNDVQLVATNLSSALDKISMVHYLSQYSPNDRKQRYCILIESFPHLRIYCEFGCKCILCRENYKCACNICK